MAFLGLQPSHCMPFWGPFQPGPLSVYLSVVCLSLEHSLYHISGKGPRNPAPQSKELACRPLTEQQRTIIAVFPQRVQGSRRGALSPMLVAATGCGAWETGQARPRTLDARSVLACGWRGRPFQVSLPCHRHKKNKTFLLPPPLPGKCVCKDLTAAHPPCTAACNFFSSP